MCPPFCRLASILATAVRGFLPAASICASKKTNSAEFFDSNLKNNVVFFHRLTNDRKRKNSSYGCLSNVLTFCELSTGCFACMRVDVSVCVCVCEVFGCKFLVRCCFCSIFSGKKLYNARPSLLCFTMADLMNLRPLTAQITTSEFVYRRSTKKIF